MAASCTIGYMIIAFAMVILLTHNEIALYSMKEGLIMKKTLKRLSALFATAIMAVSCGTMNAFADKSNASFTLTNASSEAGGLAVVDLVLGADNQCTGYTLGIEYDARLELIENVDNTMAIEYNKDAHSVYLVNCKGTPYKDGTISKLTFRLPKDASVGETFDVAISRVDDARYNDGVERASVINNSKISVKKVSDVLVYYKEGSDGSITTESALRGDVNGDGRVELNDIVAAAKSMVSKSRSADEKMAFFGDVNQDGKFDVLDLIAMARFNISSDWSKVIK